MSSELSRFTDLLQRMNRIIRNSKDDRMRQSLSIHKVQIVNMQMDLNVLEKPFLIGALDLLPRVDASPIIRDEPAKSL
jgi:hypothetical protein